MFSQNSLSTHHSRRSQPNRKLKLITDRFGTTFDNRQLLDHQWSIAAAGIRSNFFVLSCQTGRSRFLFVIRDSPSPTTITSPQPDATLIIGRENREISCNCSEFRQNQEACRHFFWLYDNILDYSYEKNYLLSPQLALSLRSDGHALASNTSPFQKIQEVGLRTIAEQKGWTYISNTSNSIASETNFERWSLKDQVIDMLRNFDSGSGSNYSDEVLSQSSTLSGAIYRLATSDVDFFANLRKEASVDQCTISVLNDIHARIHRSIEKWIIYIRTGLPNGAGPGTDAMSDTDVGGAPNIPWLANRLRRYVHRIQVELYQRNTTTHSVRVHAFEVLFYILKSVVDLDVDTDQINYRSEHPAPEIESSRERNIYDRLIRSPSENQTESFLLPAMMELADAGFHKVEELREIFHKIRPTASRKFLSDFIDLVNHIESLAYDT